MLASARRVLWLGTMQSQLLLLLPTTVLVAPNDGFDGGRYRYTVIEGRCREGTD